MENHAIAINSMKNVISTKWGMVSVEKSIPHKVKALVAILGTRSLSDKECSSVIELYVKVLSDAFSQGNERGSIEQLKDGKEHANIDMHILRLVHRSVIENSGEYVFVKEDFEKRLGELKYLGELTTQLSDVFYSGSVAAFNRGFTIGVASQMSVLVEKIAV